MVVVAALVYLLPTIRPGVWPHKKINLGLDLQGGMHLVLEVDTVKAVESTVERIVTEMQTSIKKEQIQIVGPERVEGVKIRVQAPAEAASRLEAILDKEFADLRIVSKSVNEGRITLMMDLPDKEADRIKKAAVAQALETIRNRIDQFGVSEPDIRRQADNRILIQLPGVKDTQRAKDLIGKTALLEFKLVDEGRSVEEAIQGTPPPGSQVLYETSKNPQTGRTTKTPYLIKKRALLTGESLVEARVEIDSRYGDPYVSIRFDKKGARIFERISEENVNKRLAIVLDNTVYSAPVIQEKISGGQARITGHFTTEQASDLAIVLRAGALPAPVNVLEERTVGPSLGTDSIRKGLYALAAASIAVVLFMVVYYKMSGLIANVSLLLNFLLIAAGLAAFQATLTLPGIAGIILTIATAVDANVLIYERIREELNLGKSPHAAVQAGFERAALAILDANATSLIVAAVLFQFGTGPLKGFAVTLLLGLIASLFTALITTREVFELIVRYRKVKTLSI